MRYNITASFRAHVNIVSLLTYLLIITQVDVWFRLRTDSCTTQALFFICVLTVTLTLILIPYSNHNLQMENSLERNIHVWTESINYSTVRVKVRVGVG